MRVAIALLLVMLCWSAEAQTAQDQNLQQVISKLRACVQTNASSARMAGLKDTDDTFDFFFEKCGPPVSELDPTRVGAIPPGIFRRAVGEEWRAFTGACENGCKKTCGSLNTLFAAVCLDARKQVTVVPLDRADCVSVCVSNRRSL
jgi:hypothetical protein